MIFARLPPLLPLAATLPRQRRIFSYFRQRHYACISPYFRYAIYYSFHADCRQLSIIAIYAIYC